MSKSILNSGIINFSNGDSIPLSHVVMVSGVRSGSYNIFLTNGGKFTVMDSPSLEEASGGCERIQRNLARNYILKRSDLMEALKGFYN